MYVAVEYRSPPVNATDDYFPTCAYMQVFIIHGTHDQVIDIDHSKRLLAKWPEASTHPPYFVDGAGHDDVYEMNPEEFYLQVRQFISATAMRK
jgi:fermentation-respiration switch protein FrsA (DUF1100 family)